MGANTSYADLLDALGRGRGSILVKQSPNDAGAVVWSDFYFDAAAGGTVAAVCLNVDGSLVFKPAASGSDNKIYSNSGQLFARLSAVGGDKLVSLASGVLTAS